MRGGDDAVVLRMRTDEHALLVVMLQELDEAIDGPVDDPIVQRLFPPVVEDDEDQDAQLRMIIAGDLLLRRHEAIRELLGVLGDPAVAGGPAPAGSGRGGTGGVVEVGPEGGDDAGEGSAGETGPADPRSFVEVPLPGDLPGMLLSVLNDVRLALASSIGLTAVELPQLVDEGDERAHALLAMLDYFAYVQMRLLEHIDPVAVAHADPDTSD